MTWIKYQGGRGANYVAKISACSVNVPAPVNTKGFSSSLDSLYEFLDFPDGSVVKNTPTNAGDMGSIPGSGRSLGEGNGNPLQYACLEESHGQRNMVGYSLWGCRRVGHDLATKKQQFVALLTMLAPKMLYALII